MAKGDAVSVDTRTLTNSRKSWSSFLGRVRAACKELEDSARHFFEPWFRGHLFTSYDLLPQLFRGYPHPNRKRQWNFIREQEQDLYFEFASRARELHGVIDDDWDILFAMQHYGVPTRLLDWTETLSVAVYFAIHDFSGQPGEPLGPDSDSSPCVWLLNPYELNWRSTRARDLYDPKILGWDARRREYWSYGELIIDDKEGIDWELPVAVYPRQRTNRMQAQRGWFTIHGTDFGPLEDDKRFLRRIDLPREALPAAREHLDDAGIGLFTLFPELPSLSLHLKRRRAAEVEEFLGKVARAHRSAPGHRHT